VVFARAQTITSLFALCAACRDHAPETGVHATITTATAVATAAEAVAPKAAGGTIASRSMETWVYEAPSSASRKLGYLRAGAIVATRGPLVLGEGCAGSAGGFVPIEPMGFVCLGPGATGDLDDPIVRASSRRPARSAGLPYGYAVVRNAGAPFYTRIPTEAEAKASEPDWEKHFDSLAQAEASEAREGGYPQLASRPNTLNALPIEPSPGVLAAWATDGKDDPLPFFLQGEASVPNLSGLAFGVRSDSDAGATCPKGSRTCIPLEAGRPIKRLGISFIASVEQDKRRFLVTPDLLLMPADRVRLVRGTGFHGVELGAGLELPIVFVTKPNAVRHTLFGKRTEPGAPLEFRAALNATKQEREFKGERYYVLTDGSLVRTKDAVRVDPIRKMPKWGKEGERWLEINLTKQTLLAVDGEKPVFVTLVSTGAGGVAEDTEKNPYLTPRGIFRVHTKHVSSTMDSKQPEAEFELRDVPYIQYFKDGYALHAAYWHDQFGLPRSHGCINLAPLDAARLFGFTKPEVPAAWHGAVLPLHGSVVWIHP
jgi:hypothetical protein